MRMALDDRTAKGNLTPEERRGYLRAFADRMLMKVTAMDDPEDLPGVERAVRVAAVIERLYSRCDRSEVQAPDPSKLEAERARNAVDAIEQRVVLANTLKWGEDRRKDQGQWWDDAQQAVQNQAQTPAMASVLLAMPVAVQAAPETAPQDRVETAAPRAGDLSANPEIPAPEEAIGLEPSEAVSGQAPKTASALSAESLKADYADFIDGIRNARARLGLPDIPEEALAGLVKHQPKPPPPS